MAYSGKKKRKKTNFRCISSHKLQLEYVWVKMNLILRVKKDNVFTLYFPCKGELIHDFLLKLLKSTLLLLGADKIRKRLQGS